jgi:hypothetical protein
MVTSRWWEHHSLNAYTLASTIYVCFEPGAVVLCLPPDTPNRDLSVSYALKNLFCLLVRQQAAYPYHQAREFWAV